MKLRMRISVTVLPEVEVLNIDILVWGSFALAPEKKTLFGSHLFNRDVLDGKSENDGPDHAKSHLDISINNFWKGQNQKSVGTW